MRPQAVVLQWMLFATVITTHVGVRPGIFLAGTVLLVSVYGIAAVLNDLADEATDRLNHRTDIPLASNAVTASQLAWLLLVLSSVATAVGFFEGRVVLLWVAVYVGLAWLYSGPANVQRRGILALLLLGICYGVMPWWLGAAMSHLEPQRGLVTYSLLSGVFASGIIALKDFKDEAGDRRTGKSTFLVRFGPGTTLRYVACLTCAAYVGLAVVLVAQGGYLPACAGVFLAAYSTRVLLDPRVATSPRTRAATGRRARLLFYAFATVSYAVLAGG